ncbi:MAG: DUF599 domain-containing protein [Rhodobacteraceae bacterium]|nr:MAG: DUF599 domain-containing protein [Paracoccaceae bacterium]
MTWIDRLQLFNFLDLAAIALLLASWQGIGLVVERSGRRKSVSTLTSEYRRDWMEQMLTRDPRIFDSQILGILRQGTAFFASTCMIVIGGALALLGNTDRLAGLAEDLALGSGLIVVWEIKLMVVILLMVDGFLKFVWSHRLFGYCAVVMAAVPNDPDHPAARPRAMKAAELNITAARAYNRGLRSIYFAMAAAAWLLGAVPLILAVLFTLAVLYRREFASQSREALLVPETDPATTPETP